MKDRLQSIIDLSLKSAPEDMLKASLETCIDISNANGGSILGEEGPHLKFLFSNLEEIIGRIVPFDSVAGDSARRNMIIYTFAPSDKRHFEGVDKDLRHETKYLVSMPIPSIHQSSADASHTIAAGVLQLLFETNIVPDVLADQLPIEVPADVFEKSALALCTPKLMEVYWILPIVALGMEIVHLRQTSWQAIHELKNKMISALSWMSYLKNDIIEESAQVFENESVQEDYELAESSIKESAELAKTYLQFTKVFEPHFKAASVNEIMNNLAAGTKAFADDIELHNLNLEYKTDPDIPEREIDPEQMTMALFNLCKNGIEALAQHSTENPEMKITTLNKGDSIEISIMDNGPGMPEDIADNLFIPFKTKKEGGTGLGLAIAKKIIDIHGGTIVCNTGETGTEFIINL